MTCGETLDEIRESYLKRFSAVVHELKRSGNRIVTEAIFRDHKGNPVEEGRLCLPLRGDVFVLSAGRVIESKRIHASVGSQFEVIEFTWEGTLEIRMLPFRWDECRVRILDPIVLEAWEPLISWFLRWFDPEDRKSADERGLCGEVHELSDPLQELFGMVVTVDFGSAPVEAFEEFLDALRDLGVRKVQLGSPTSAPGET
jgi:hypothetical protein